jgi:hypothetical protein
MHAMDLNTDRSEVLYYDYLTGMIDNDTEF